MTDPEKIRVLTTALQRIDLQGREEPTEDYVSCGNDDDIYLAGIVAGEHGAGNVAREALAAAEGTAGQDGVELIAAEHRAVIANLASALCPDSPAESAQAEFALDAMGACQIIRRIRAERDQLRAAQKACIEAIMKLDRRGLDTFEHFVIRKDGWLLDADEVHTALKETLGAGEHPNA